MKLSFEEFDAVYQPVVQAALRFWKPSMQEEIARHCAGWLPGRFDFGNYLRVSTIRYYYAYLSSPEETRTVCDVGGFWGVFPVTMARLGYEVSMTEALQYYGESFNDLFRFIEDEGVTIRDYDPFDASQSTPGRYSFVTVMAVLEHYPHSLRTFMGNVREMMEPDGALYLEVPNIAYWPKRVSFLRGVTPQTPIADVYSSAEPFIGHHHEFTLAELRDLARLADLSIIGERTYNYSVPKRHLRWRLRHPVETLAFRFVPDSRECLAVLCERRGEALPATEGTGSVGEVGQ